MKYVTLENGIGQGIVVVFDNECIHAFMASAAMKSRPDFALRSAGLYTIRNSQVTITGASESLGLGPMEGDEEILRLRVIEGLSSLQVNNLKMYATIQGIPFEDALSHFKNMKKGHQESGD